MDPIAYDPLPGYSGLRFLTKVFLRWGRWCDL